MMWKLMGTALIFAGQLAAGPTSCHSTAKRQSDTTLTGTPVAQIFHDANGNAERAIVLKLEEPISHGGDKFGGPVANVREVQLVFTDVVPSERDLSKRIRVRGKLFYPMTAHHHTQILLEVQEIEIVE